MSVESVRDQLDLQRVLFDYAWCCDNADWKQLRSLFTDDAYLDYSSSMDGPAGGPDEVCKWLEDSLSQVAMIQHVVSNFQLSVSGDKASGRAMFYTSVRIPAVEELVLTGGYYELGFVHGPLGWRIQRLIEDNRWMTNAPGGQQH
jgi:SnoaL-like domain